MGNDQYGSERTDRHPSDPRIIDHSYGESPLALAAKAADVDKPKTMQEARTSKRATLWINAEEKEKAALIKNDVYKVVDINDVASRPLSVKLVFKVKRRADGEIERAKIRCVYEALNRRRELTITTPSHPLQSFNR
jgi:hypothetical protein